MERKVSISGLFEKVLYSIAPYIYFYFEAFVEENSRFSSAKASKKHLDSRAEE